MTRQHLGQVVLESTGLAILELNQAANWPKVEVFENGDFPTGRPIPIMRFDSVLLVNEG